MAEEEKTHYVLDDLRDLEIALYRHRDDLFIAESQRPVRMGDLYCPVCGDARRMDAVALHGSPIPKVVHRQLQSAEAEAAAGKVVELGATLSPDAYSLPLLPPPPLRTAPARLLVETLVPLLMTFTCVQCETLFTGLVYLQPDGPALAIFPNARGGLTTPNTPAAVGYYLDQAHKAQSVGANSAAVAMFRAALDQLLFEQRYTQRMVGPKLVALKADIDEKTAKPWAMELDTAFLQVLKDLGDGAIHPNDGDISKQAELDGALVSKVKEVFLLLLFVVYEAPKKKAGLLEELRRKAGILKK